MSTIVEKIRREPVLATAFVGAILYLLTEFGVPVTEGQQAAILGICGAALAFVARSSVTPVDTAGRPREVGHASVVEVLLAVLVVIIILVLVGVL